MYMVYSHGYMISHSRSSDCRQHTLKFGEDDIITVEFEPYSRVLTVRKRG